jgi:hypothetical protein
MSPSHQWYGVIPGAVFFYALIVVAVALFACLARINALYMIARAGSGHIGSSFSCSGFGMGWVLGNDVCRDTGHEAEHHGGEEKSGEETD